MNIWEDVNQKPLPLFATEARMETGSISAAERERENSEDERQGMPGRERELIEKFDRMENVLTDSRETGTRQARA